MYLFALAAITALLAPVQPGLPNRQPQLATGAGLTALVFGSGNSIWFSRSLDNGQTFSTPSKVAQVPVLNQATKESDTHATAEEGRLACFCKACVTSAAW